MSPPSSSSSSSRSQAEAGGLRMASSSSWSSCWHKLSCRCWFSWQLVHDIRQVRLWQDTLEGKGRLYQVWYYSFYFHLTVSPASCLQEVPEELLITREGWGRAGPNNSIRLNKTLFQTLQTPQTLSSQHAQQVGIWCISRRAVHSWTFTHLKENGRFETLLGQVKEKRHVEGKIDSGRFRGKIVTINHKFV